MPGAKDLPLFILKDNVKNIRDLLSFYFGYSKIYVVLTLFKSFRIQNTSDKRDSVASRIPIAEDAESYISGVMESELLSFFLFPRTQRCEVREEQGTLFSDVERVTTMPVKRGLSDHSHHMIFIQNLPNVGRYSELPQKYRGNIR